MKLLLTGGHSGIGLELTRRLLKEGHHLGLIIRNEKRKAAAIEAIGTAENIDFFYADLSVQKEVLAVIASIQTQWDHMDGLFNNAGVLLGEERYSPQGNEMHFEVNTLTPYVLTTGLKPLLDKADHPFVVTTATGGLHRKKSLDIAELKKPKKFVKLLGSYLTSKFAMALLMNHLSGQWKKIRVLTVDPGPNKTKMTKGEGMPALLKPFRNLFFSKPAKGAGKMYDAAFKKEFADLSGIYVTGGKAKTLITQLSEGEVKEVLSQ